MAARWVLPSLLISGERASVAYSSRRRTRRNSSRRWSVATRRTMEIFRRMGLAGKIRSAGLREDVPMDVYVVLAMNVPPLLHLPYPSVADARAEIAATNDGTKPLRALPAYLAIYAGAAPQGSRGRVSNRIRSLRLRVRVVDAERALCDRSAAQREWRGGGNLGRLSGWM